jgi:UMP-CMP kinase family protein
MQRSFSSFLTFNHSTIIRRYSTTKKIYFVLGGPGSGKGTQCERLTNYGFAHLCAGELLRSEVASGSETGQMLSTLMKEGKIVPGHITIGLLKKQIDSLSENTQILIDGFPREIQQALDFEKTVTPCEFVVLMDCTEDILEQRLLKRGETSGRSDDNIESIKKRFTTHQIQTTPVIQYYEKQGKLKRIDGSKSQEQVFEQMKHVFQLE